MALAFAMTLVVGCGGGTTTSKHPDAGPADHPQADADAGDDGIPEASGDAAPEASGDAPGDDASDGGAPADAASTADAEAAAIDAGDASTADAEVAGDADAAAPRLVTVVFTGKVVTVASAPLGFDSSARLEPVSGSFTYDLRLLDDEPNDPLRGKYWRAGTTAFSFTVKGHTVTGSGLAIAETENLSPDTFRFLDGPQGDAVVRTMKVDGADAPTLKLGIAISDSSGALLSSDALPDPFPTIDVTKAPISHTFSLTDNGGTLLIQLDTLANQ